MEFEWPLPRVLLAALTGAVVVALLVGAGTSSASLGAYNTGWDGTSQVSAAAEASGTSTTVARNVSSYADTEPDGTLAVVLSPDDRYGPAAGTVGSFVRSGGTLLVAEDYGSGGNELLRAVGADARVDGRPLRDEERAGPSPAFPRAAVNSSHPVTRGVDTLVLNHGTVVEPGNATVVANSSSFSYLDGNRNRTLDDSETLRARPVVTVEDVGNGTVIVVSDPSVFLNSMQERGDNAAFLTGLVSRHETVLLDVSHTRSVPPLVALQLALRDSPLGIVLVGVLSIGAVLALLSDRRLPRLRDRGRSGVDAATLSRSDVLTVLRNRHPEWDEDRIQRVTRSLIQSDTNEGTDD